MFLQPNEYWEMTNDEFNEWRIKNDFPRLFEYFQKSLNGFKDWQIEYKIDDDEIINTGIADFFIYENSLFDLWAPNTNKYYFKQKDQDGKISELFSPKKYNIGDVNKLDENIYFNIIDSKLFVPYLYWARKNKIAIHKRAVNCNVRVTSISAALSPECKVYILDNIELLKLGGIDGVFNGSLGGKMLQFVNLDFLNFKGRYFDSYGKYIAFSSTRYWKITNSQLHFFKLFDTSLEHLYVEDSLLDDWNIVRCYNGYDCKIMNSVLTRSRIGVGGFIPYFDNVDLRDSEVADDYEKGAKYGYPPTAELMRHVKNCFALRGQHSQAGKYYYREKSIERIKHKYNILRHFSKLLKFSWSGIRVWFYNLKQGFVELFLYIKSLLFWFWWGYGERPWHLIIISLLVISFASLVIYNPFSNDYTLLDSIYYSFKTFLAFGDTSIQLDGLLKMLEVIVAFTGKIIIAFLVAGYAMKFRY